MWHKTKDGLILFGQFTDKHLQCPWACRNNEGDMIKWQSLLDIIPQLLITLDLIQILSMAYEALLDLILDSLLDFILYQASFFFYFPGTLAFLMSFTHQPHSSRMEFALVLSPAEMLFA